MYLHRLRTFWAAYRQQPFSTAEVTLYTYLADEADRLGVDQVVRRDLQLASDLDTSVNTLKTARNGLEGRRMLVISGVLQGSKQGVGYGFTSSEIDEVKPEPAPTSSKINEDAQAPHRQKLMKTGSTSSKTDEVTSSKIDEEATHRQKLTMTHHQKLTKTTAQIPQLLDFQRHEKIAAAAQLVLKGKRKSIVYSVLYANTLNTFSATFSLFARKSQNANVPVDTVMIGQVSVDADDLFSRLNIRGSNVEQINAFVEAHAGRIYNDLAECGSVVRAWLRKNKPKAAPLSVSQRQLALREELAVFYRANPAKYPKECYAEFFKYYAEPSKSGRTIRRDSQAFFDIDTKLDYHYKNFYLKRQSYGNGNAKNERQLGYIQESDLTGEHDANDGHAADREPDGHTIHLTADPPGDEVDQLPTGDYGGLYVTLE